MKKIVSTLMLLSVAIMLHAIPAKPGQWKTIRLADGSTLRVELRGDEHARWYQAEDGRMFVKAQNADYYVATTTAAIQQKAIKHRTTTAKHYSKRAKAMKKAQNPIFQGARKGLIIMAQFQDTKFAAGHDVALYNKIANQLNYKENGFYGSISDYFRHQSNGQFELSFDVKGVVTLPQNMAYYGGNDSDGDDMRPAQMVIDALEAVKAEINLADYDWDGDGEVEEVFVLYAGKGEANGGSDDTVWPHMWSVVAGTGNYWTYNGYRVDTYACSAELNGYNELDGVGTFCHEFSHCMGFPDMYDTSYGGNYGMGDYDLMCGGSYNGNGRYPANYSAYERAECGWIELTELTGTGSVTNLACSNDHGPGYVVYNQAHKDERFIIENRQRTGWDTYIPKSGLMIHYIDYDATVWEYNIPNTICDYSSYATQDPGNADYWRNYKNDHQRLCFFHADNNAKSDNIYPYGARDSLTNRSTPAGRLYHANSDGTKYMNIAITKITQNYNGTMSFNYAPSESRIPQKPDHTDALFYESFDQCAGTGAWDGQWSGSIASATFTPDNSGWQANRSYGAQQCARFGTGTAVGSASTPEFEINGTATFAFMAAPWGSDGTTLRLSVGSGNATITPNTFTMTAGEWSTFNATITGTGKVRITFSPTKRIFLDEIVAKGPTPTGINTINANTDANVNSWYTLDGRRLNAKPTQKGIYLNNGKKVILK